jgi:hypothetical protein
VVGSATEVAGELVWGATKTYERRTVRRPRFLCERLGAYLAGRSHAPGELVFTMPQGGQYRATTCLVGKPLRRGSVLLLPH